MEIVKKIFGLTSKMGLDDSLSDYKKKRLIIFNTINAFGFLFAVCWFLETVVFSANEIDNIVGAINLLPMIISIFSFVLVYLKQYKLAIYLNTLLIPLAIVIANIYLEEGSGLLYLTIYAIFPFFFHSKFYKIVIHYAYIVGLYGISAYFLKLNDVASTRIIFTAWLQVAAFLFFFAALYLAKVQITAYEHLLKRNKELLDLKNKELLKLLTLKDQIYTVISHDIMVPLNSMQMLASQVMEEGYNKDLVHEICPVMIDELVKTKNLFSNLLDWSKSQLEGRGQRTANVAISEIVLAVLNQINKQADVKNIKIVNNIDKEIIADVNKDNLMVALRNLIVNAIKFTPKGGIITLCAKILNDHVQLNVSDSGAGITKETRKKIFADSVYTTLGTNEESGNGFGLKISRELMKQNGGSVFCETSTVGEGSTFGIKMKSPKSEKVLDLVA